MDTKYRLSVKIHTYMVMHSLVEFLNVIGYTPMLSYVADPFRNFKEFMVKRSDIPESSQKCFCYVHM